MPRGTLTSNQATKPFLRYQGSGQRCMATAAVAAIRNRSALPRMSQSAILTCRRRLRVVDTFAVYAVDLQAKLRKAAMTVLGALGLKGAISEIIEEA